MPSPHSARTAFYLGIPSDKKTLAQIDKNETKLVLVDASEQHVVSLRRNYRNVPNVTIINKVVSDVSEACKFFEYSIPELSSIYSALDAKVVLPNLRVVSATERMSVAVHELINDFACGESFDLHINLPGQELRLLKALKDHGLLNNLASLSVVSCSKRVYSEGCLKEEVVDWLITNHFGIRGTKTVNQLLQLERVCFKFDEVSLQNSLLKKELSAEKEKSKKLSALNRELNRKLSNSASEYTDTCQIQNNINKTVKSSKLSLPDIVSKDSELKAAVESWLEGHFLHLIELDNASLADKANRELLVLLAATGYQFKDDAKNEERCVNLASRWGISDAHIKAMLMTGVYIRLARANALMGKVDETKSFFRRSLTDGIFGVENIEDWLTKRTKNQLIDIMDETSIRIFLTDE
ncbi:hypothetical protein BFR57_02470 [Idiomarina sp. MD25a]|nr:hypothetical protein BFR57_02470 [Idiomarina sp. MD25a]